MIEFLLGLFYGAVLVIALYERSRESSPRSGSRRTQDEQEPK